MARREFSEPTDKIVATEPVEIRRYATHTRINHWFTAFLIILLILSGFALFHPSLFFLTALFGGGQAARFLHPIFGVVACLSFLLLFLQLWRLNIMRREDVVWAQNINEVLSGHEERLPELGKYNLGQKMVFWGMFWLLLAMVISGVMIWQQFFPDLVSIPVRRWAVLVHSVSAVLAVLVIIVHVYAAFWTRGTLSAMTSGRVTGGWAWKHHRKWLREVARRQDTPPAE
ncbi:formate dehydrogenase subunit gamma [Paracoccus aerodenitrificans]|uniref:formate dehydrogenase subunit gamma n=1 Tax=Paracoccus aerodenitrificans TaxID=3017781 RepID=UPI0022F11E7A|nr:formate dehydrogenase subunit gamma [Paracoccus aerodenitrificans]WBU65414.1 formate dehydrogenase subunit gamma [Paracoccus aerodenitrificans]